jgi:putative radical SAM enzyme (TIGR03279 family)
MNGNADRSGERFLKRSPWLAVERVEEGGLAENMGVRSGDHLVSINGHPIYDCIDFQFYSADAVLNCVFQRKNRTLEMQFHKEDGRDMGLEFLPMRFKGCGNHCVFCFVDQNPSGLRSSLYFKDEDYRLSFLHGNYVTLTHVTQTDLDRIVEQRLSPLYVSIHAVDQEVRKRMLGLKKEDHLMEKIRYLLDRGVQIHGQIVLCPQWNDGDVLLESLETLSSFFPGLRSLALVPVGLTDHRGSLEPLKGYAFDNARALILSMGPIQRKYIKKFKESFVYLADEFYLLAEKTLPSENHYSDFWQIENGVGMTRQLLNSFQEMFGTMPKSMKQPCQAVIVTGTLAAPVINKKLIPKLNRIKNLKVECLGVLNRFFGEAVTVSGLLTAGDILESLHHSHRDAVVLLPSNCLNTDSLFLDDWTLDAFKNHLNRRVLVSQDFHELWEIL